MPEPGITDRNFNDPTSDRQKPRRRKSRPRLQIPGEYAEFRLEDGRFLGEVMEPDFFGPDSGSVTEEQREKLREGNYPLARMVRDDPDSFAPRPEAEAGIPYRDGAMQPPVFSPRYSRDSAPGTQDRGGQAGTEITYRDGATVAARPDPARGGASKPEFADQAFRGVDKVAGAWAGSRLFDAVYEAHLRDTAERDMAPGLHVPPNLREQGELNPSAYRVRKYAAASPGEKGAMTRELEDRFADHLGALVGAHQRMRATGEVPDPMKYPGATAGRVGSEILEAGAVGLLGQIPGLSYVLGMPEDVIIHALGKHGIDPADPDTDIRDAGVLVSDPAFRGAVLVNFPFGGAAPEGNTVGERIGRAGENNIGPFIKDQVKMETIKRIIEKLR